MRQSPTFIAIEESMVYRTENTRGTPRERQRIANAALTEREVARIKTLLKEGESPRELSQAYRVGIETIRRINRGDSWSWVRPDDEIPEMPVHLGPQPSAEEIAASQRRLADLLAREGLAPVTEVSAQDTPPTDVMERFLNEANAERARKLEPEKSLDRFIEGKDNAADKPSD